MYLFSLFYLTFYLYLSNRTKHILPKWKDFFSWKSRTNHKTHKYNQNQQQSHVPYKNSPQHQIFYIKEKTHIYILVSPCGEYLLLCGWLTEHQNSKTYLSLYTTSWTIYITQTNKLQSSTLPLLPQTLESTKFCAKMDFSCHQTKTLFRLFVFLSNTTVSAQNWRHPFEIPWPCSAKSLIFQTEPTSWICKEQNSNGCSKTLHKTKDTNLKTVSLNCHGCSKFKSWKVVDREKGREKSLRFWG